LVKEERPLLFFGALASLVLICAAAVFAPVVVEYWQTGLVPRFPTLIVAVGSGVVAALLFTCGLILDTVARARIEGRRLAYLSASLHAPPWRARQSRAGAYLLPADASARADEACNA
jgi:hypothetical protein